MERVAEVLRKVGTETDQNTRKQNMYTSSVKRSSDAAEKLKGTVIGIGATLVSAYAVNKVLETSSLMTNTKARLDLINDGQQTTAELNDMIFQSANRAYGSYTETADSVAKLAGQTDGLFNSTREIVAFTELLNKQFIISGVSAHGASSVMLQMTQALSSGVLRGEEFNAIFENAPQIIGYIAKSMGKPIDSMKELAAAGEITAQEIKNAMFLAAEDINKKFEQMPLTWEDMKTKLQNNLLQAFQPLWEEMESIMNSSTMTDFITIA